MLTAAAALFWLSWVLMPGVGVTDPAQIFALVSSQRPLVVASVVVQLVSAVLYVPALVGLMSHAPLRRVPRLGWSVGLLLVGAIGSAADAVLHLLAYAMTAPGLEMATLVRVMAFMQGPGLLMLAPLILSFFVGGGALSVAFAHGGIVSRWNPWLHLIAVAIAVVGGALASRGMLPARAVGLTALAAISLAQAWAGLAIARYAPVPAVGFRGARFNPSIHLC